MSSSSLETAEKMTDEEAEAMLVRLSEHFRAPVMPIKRYCDVLREWFDIMERRERVTVSEPNDRVDYGRVLINIRKSNLLARRLYGGEKLRSKKCPIHQGKWSGIEHCPEGCESTGWIPDDLPPKEARAEKVDEIPGTSWRAKCFACRREIITAKEQRADDFVAQHERECVAPMKAQQ